MFSLRPLVHFRGGYEGFFLWEYGPFPSRLLAKERKEFPKFAD